VTLRSQGGNATPRLQAVPRTQQVYPWVTRRKVLCRVLEGLFLPCASAGPNGWRERESAVLPYVAVKTAEAHRNDGKRFVVHADEKLTAFVELESEIRGDLS
jgi:hypothetical protein